MCQGWVKKRSALTCCPGGNECGRSRRVNRMNVCVQVLELRSGLCLRRTASLCPWLSASCLNYHQSAPRKVRVHANTGASVS